MGDGAPLRPHHTAAGPGRRGERGALGVFARLVRLMWAVAVVVAGIAVLSVFSAGALSLCFGTALGTHVLRSVDRDGASLGAQALRVCLEDPTAWDRALVIVERALPVVGYAVLSHLLLRVLERAVRDGAHTAATANRVRVLGWATLVLPLVTTLAQAVARIELLTPLVPELTSHYTRLPMEWDVPWWAVVTGVGLPAMSTIMRAGAEMRLDLEGTV
ncbi:hypothetical protein [Saccharothrix sp. Mg75]|uniref:hypothetical protein n=1 Tax=Saccharothrix sp. Mg75 TaxID=3445357 RepID=UPI003EE9AC03